jgi:hypothetical protein
MVDNQTVYQSTIVDMEVSMNKKSVQRLKNQLARYHEAKATAMKWYESSNEDKTPHLEYREQLGVLADILKTSLSEADIVQICSFIVTSMEHWKYDEDELHTFKQAVGIYQGTKHSGWVSGNEFITIIDNIEQKIYLTSELESIELISWYSLN